MGHHITSHHITDHGRPRRGSKLTLRPHTATPTPQVLEMDPEFLSDGEHAHDEQVYSVGFEVEGELNMEKTNTWIAKLLQVDR